MEVQESSDFERLSCVARMPAVDRWIHQISSIDTGWCFGVKSYYDVNSYYGVNLCYGVGLNYMVRQCSALCSLIAVGTKDEVIQLF